jgi:hypothetical protein
VDLAAATLPCFVGERGNCKPPRRSRQNAIDVSPIVEYGFFKYRGIMSIVIRAENIRWAIK